MYDKEDRGYRSYSDFPTDRQKRSVPTHDNIGLEADGISKVGDHLFIHECYEAVIWMDAESKPIRMQGSHLLMDSWGQGCRWAVVDGFEHLFI